MNEWESYMGIKPPQSDAIRHLKGLRMTLVKSPDYIKIVHEKLKYPFLVLAWKVQLECIQFLHYFQLNFNLAWFEYRSI